MTMVLTNATSDFDGSGSPATATGPINITYSGTSGSGPKQITLMSRSDTADYVNTFTTNEFGRWRVDLANGDEFYFLAQVASDASIDLSYVAA